MSANVGTLSRFRERIKEAFGVKATGTAGSVFTAGKMELFIQILILFLLTVVTLGIGFAWFFVKFMKWLYSHIKINGKTITFNATGGQLFVKLLIWGLLSVVTVGFYLIFFYLRGFCKFIVKNTQFEGENGKSEFLGGIIEWLLVLLAFGNIIVWIFAPTLLLSYLFGNSVISGKKLSFHLNGMGYWAQVVYWTVMGIITLGFYFFLGSPFYRSFIEMIVENLSVSEIDKESLSINDNSVKKEKHIEGKTDLKSGNETKNTDTGKTKLIVERLNNIMCSSIPFEIFIDNKKTFSIKNASRFSGFIKNGAHSICAKIDNNTQSEIIKFNADNSDIKFRIRVLEMEKIKLEKIIL